MTFLILSMFLTLTLAEFQISIPSGYEYIGRYGAGDNIAEVYRSDEMGVVFMVVDTRQVTKEFQLERDVCFENFCQGVIDKGGELLASGRLDIDGTRWDWRTLFKCTDDGKLMGCAFFYFRGKADGWVAIVFMGLEAEEEDIREYCTDLMKTMMSPME